MSTETETENNSHYFFQTGFKRWSQVLFTLDVLVMRKVFQVRVMGSIIPTYF